MSQRCIYNLLAGGTRIQRHERPKVTFSKEMEMKLCSLGLEFGWLVGKRKTRQFIYRGNRGERELYTTIE